VLSPKNAYEVEEIWKEKFKLIYKHNVLDIKDKQNTKEREDSEFKKQSYRYK
jgi:hypothetical protein